MKSTINFSDPIAKARFCNDARRLEGAWDVEFKRHYAGRTNRQNRTYRGMICPRLADWITENWQDECTPEEAHGFIVRTLLARSIVNKKTGQVIELVKSTTRLNTIQFADFWEKARQLVEELTGEPIPDPDPDYKKKRVAAGADSEMRRRGAA